MRRAPWPGLLALVAVGALVVAIVVVGSRVALELRTPDDARPTLQAEQDGRDPARPRGVPADAEAATVARVIDGDTIRIVGPDRGQGSDPETTTRVRLLNIDAPELDHPDHGRECGAGSATAAVEQLLPPGSTIWLAGDREDRDRFDRLLRYAWSEAGDDVQAALVEAGLAEVLVVAPNDRFADGLRDLERAARAGAVGIWGPGCPD